MKRFGHMYAALASLVSVAAVQASDAETSATAGSRNGRPGNAAATARYEGDVGFARTDSRSGRINLARGVALGVDRDGLSLSVSNAIAGQRGPAVASNFNLSIGRDGVSHSGGLSVADGPLAREASAGGGAGNGPLAGPARSYATGRTDRFGRVRTHSYANDQPRLVRPSPVSHRRAAALRGTDGRRLQRGGIVGRAGGARVLRAPVHSGYRR